MPIYEYRCGKCKTVFEILRDRSQRDAEAVCTSCGGRKAQRQMSGFSGHVSGSGGGSVAGSGGCGSCKATSCAGCGRN